MMEVRAWGSKEPAWSSKERRVQTGTLCSDPRLTEYKFGIHAVCREAIEEASEDTTLLMSNWEGDARGKGGMGWAVLGVNLSLCEKLRIIRFGDGLEPDV